jgi:hypothetical protein
MCTIQHDLSADHGIATRAGSDWINGGEVIDRRRVNRKRLRLKSWRCLEGKNG